MQRGGDSCREDPARLRRTLEPEVSPSVQLSAPRSRCPARWEQPDHLRRCGGAWRPGSTEWRGQWGGGDCLILIQKLFLNFFFLTLCFPRTKPQRRGHACGRPVPGAGSRSWAEAHGKGWDPTGSNERTRPAQSGDSARLPFIIVITFLVRGKNCLLKLNPRSQSDTKLTASVPLRDRGVLGFSFFR